MVAESSIALEARGLRVVRSRRVVLQAVDLQCAYGETLAILGPNGAGKSTLLRALAGVLPCEGSLRIAGRDAAELSLSERALELGYVAQNSALRAALSVEEVVAQGRFAQRRRLFGRVAGDGGTRAVHAERASQAIDAALKRTDLVELRRRSYLELSFGEQRRVMLARTLASGARILCLDEPTAALDVGHALDLFALLGELAAEGYALVVVLHALDDALRFADRALLLNRGRTVVSGACSDVLARSTLNDVYHVELEERAGVRFHRMAQSTHVGDA